MKEDSRLRLPTAKLRMICNNVHQAIYSTLVGKDKKYLETQKKFIEIYIEQDRKEKEDMFMFTSMSYHARQRYKERFKVFGYTIADIKNDILHAKKWTRSKLGTVTVHGKLGQYIISSDKILITVI